MHVFKLPTLVFSIHLGNCVDCVGGLQSLDPELVTWLFTGGQNVSIFPKKKKKKYIKLGIKHLSSHLQVILTMFFPDKTIKNLTHNL
jgi:hypothetical protein